MKIIVSLTLMCFIKALTYGQSVSVDTKHLGLSLVRCTCMSYDGTKEKYLYSLYAPQMEDQLSEYYPDVGHYLSSIQNNPLTIAGCPVQEPNNT